VGGVTANQEILESRVSLYPNPTSYSVNIAHVEGVEHIMLYNAQGKLLMTQKTEGTKSNVEMGKYPTGLYFIQLDNSAFMHRIVKQ
jgi:hypothetical protein